MIEFTNYIFLKSDMNRCNILAFQKNAVFYTYVIIPSKLAIKVGTLENIGYIRFLNEVFYNFKK